MTENLQKETEAAEYLDNTWTPPKRFMPLDPKNMPIGKYLITNGSSYAVACWHGDTNDWIYVGTVEGIEFSPTHYAELKND